MVNAQDLQVAALGQCRIRSPIPERSGENGHDPHFVDDSQRILLDDRISQLPTNGSDDAPPSLELAGPRRSIYFDPSKTRVGVVTCGGLCPGLNDVIRGLVMESHYRYGVRKIYGFRYGYQGFIAEYGHELVELNAETVSEIHEDGGTILGSSRGPQDTVKIVDCLDRLGVNILYVIGGDGTIRAALALIEEIANRGLKIAVLGVPKTVDNDILYIDQSFGFETAYSKAVEAILSAHMEAKGAPNGVGLVKVMGRHSGFIACHAALATSHVNFVLIPEVPFQLNGGTGFLDAVRQRLVGRHHAVIVVAEGAGQEHLQDDGRTTDASGNAKLKDIGVFLADQIQSHFKQIGQELNLKFIDPSYTIRSVPASPPDSVYCWRLAQNAVHAAMCGKTAMVVGQWHGRFIHVPMVQAISGCKHVDPEGDLWLSVLESTGQPAAYG